MTPIIMWTGTSNQYDEDDEHRIIATQPARVVIVENEKAKYHRDVPKYKLVPEISEGKDAMGVARWQPMDDLFPEFQSWVAEQYLKEKGAKP